ncbi:MAG: hypothetical protein ACREX4_01290 [Gammaproteobacteria bacterium]
MSWLGPPVVAVALTEGVHRRRRRRRAALRPCQLALSLARVRFLGREARARWGNSNGWRSMTPPQTDKRQKARRNPGGDT